jgi:hypothetical protein
MTQIATMTTEPQRMRALEQANRVRLARAQLKRRIANGHMSAAEVILELPSEAKNWSVGELLMSQRRWGSIRARKLLIGLHISEKRAVGELTERQRGVLAALLPAHEPPVVGVPVTGSACGEVTLDVPCGGAPLEVSVPQANPLAVPPALEFELVGV